MTTVLNTEQEAALNAIQAGKNIFLTGAGGTGKSHTIRAIMNCAAIHGTRIAVTAMTGCAALLLNYEGSPYKARTLHSWAGVGLATGSVADLEETVKRNKKAKFRWNYTQTLIIDEVSMMTAEFLEKLDLLARRIRKQPEARFGGIQIVFAGDFCQLPPVSQGATKFVFQSPIWASLIDESHNLIQIIRQNDPVFQRLLTEARMGALSPQSIEVLKGRKGLPWASNLIRPTLLYARNADVDHINRENMAALTGERRTYTVSTVTKATHMGGNFLSGEIQCALTKLDSDAPYDATLELCVGAQVMLLTNMNQEKGLVNGSRGVVTGYSDGGLPLVLFKGFEDSVLVDKASWWLAEPDTVGRSQIPLKIAYAISIHKSQGATLDSVLIDIGSNTFEYGQAYVALSRCRSLEGLYIWSLDKRMILCHPAVRRFYESLESTPPDPNNTGH
jgi:ATP-dependent DNA helicase PIF1